MLISRYCFSTELFSIIHSCHLIMHNVIPLVSLMKDKPNVNQAMKDYLYTNIIHIKAISQSASVISPPPDVPTTPSVSSICQSPHINPKSTFTEFYITTDGVNEQAFQHRAAIWQGARLTKHNKQARLHLTQHAGVK